MTSSAFVVFIACAGLFAGGVVKGVGGFALPITAVAVMSNFLPGTMVLGLMTIPIVVTNFWQLAASGPVRPELRRFWPEALVMCTALVVSARYASLVDSRTLYLVIAVVVLIFVAASTLVRIPRIPAPLEKPVGMAFAAISGTTGGLTTIWGPTMVMYLSALDLDKDRYVRVIGLIWFAASIPLTAMYVRTGILNRENVYLSAALCIPAIAGMVGGKLIRDRLNQRAFKTVVLVLLTIAALNVLRKALS